MNLGTAIIRYVSPALFIGTSIFGTGCMAADEQMDAATHDEFVRNDGDQPDQIIFGIGGDPETHNHLRPEVLLNHGVQQTVRDLKGVPLVNANNQLPYMQYMPSPSATGDLAGARVEFLEVLIGCALSPTQTVSDPAHTLFVFNNIAFKKTYSGAIGLAPNWTTRGLTTTEKEFVTACVLQRVNRIGESVEILLEGNQPILAATEQQLLDYPGFESKAWGNMFDSTKPLSTTSSRTSATASPFDAYICHEEATCNTGEDGILRDCDTSGGCGFQYVGECTDFGLYCAMRQAMGYPTTASCAGFTRSIRARLQEADLLCFAPLDIPLP